MTTRLILTRDINGYNTFGLMPADDQRNVTLSQNAEQSVTVPTNFNVWYAIFAFDPGLRIYVARGTTATLPGPVFAPTHSTLNPNGWQVNAGERLSFITADISADVWVGFYAIQ